MRFAVLLVDGAPTLTVRRGDGYLPLSAVDPSLPRELGALLRARVDLHALAAAVDAAPLDGLLDAAEVVYAPPIAEGARVLCLGLNYVDHAKEASFTKPDYPVVFARFASSFVGHDQAMELPAVSSRFDYEAELAVVIGRGGRHIARETALQHVAGYALLNDGSVRDYQRHSAQWLLGKNFDRSGAMGPELVTADELPPGARGLALLGLLNGAVMQEGNTSDMIFDVETTLAYVSQAIALVPGDVIAMGTPSGVGNARNPQVFLKAGDTFEVRVERVGSLCNPIRPETTTPQLETAS
jgi:acylpyruvate hydrolase